MGASQAREADARLALAVPVHKTLGKRRILDPAATECAVCKAKFAPLFRKKHYCRRCGAIVCDACTSLRTYGNRLSTGGNLDSSVGSDDSATRKKSGGSPTSSTAGSPAVNRPQLSFRVCATCNLRRSAVAMLPESCWCLIFDFAGTKSHHHALQSCRRLQLVANLPFPSGSGWDTFFGPSHFLAKGANGAVYKTKIHAHVAQQLGLRGTPTVAVKVVNKVTVFSLRKWHHVLREVESMRTCRHQNILRLLGVFQAPEAVFLVLEFAPGGDVFDWFVNRRGCSEQEVKAVMRQLLVALQHMHDNCGAVHRDVKPENLFLMEKAPAAPSGKSSTSVGRLTSGSVPPIVLGDFGYARVFPEAINPRRPPTGTAPAPVIATMQARLEAADRSITAAATPCGTLGFAPPEVLQAYADRRSKAEAPAAPVTPVEIMKKTDIFAAGITMCMLLTGMEPFPRHSSHANVAAVQQGINFETKQWAHVSSAARNLVRQMLAASADDRPSAYDCLASSWFASNAAAPSTLSLQVTGPMPTNLAPPRSGGGADRPGAEVEECIRSLRRTAGAFATVALPGQGPAVGAVPRRATAKEIDLEDDLIDRQRRAVTSGAIGATPRTVPNAAASVSSGSFAGMNAPPSTSNPTPTQKPAPNGKTPPPSPINGRNLGGSCSRSFTRGSPNTLPLHADPAELDCFE
jgi:serine/threonine protein kinase